MSASADMTFTMPGGARVDGHVGRHVIRTDQLPDDSAPSPFTLFLASIGACAGFYVQAFCRKRGIPTDDIRVVQHNHATPDGRVDRVELSLELPEGFPDKYRAAIIAAAEQCTVKKHLEHPPQIGVSIAALV